jgi:hypothetical protein
MPPEASKKLPADRLDRALSGEGLEWWIYSAFPKDGWIARKRGDLTHADHPGTAIRLGDEVFEIVAAEETAAPGYMVRYGLARWLSEHAIRRVILYTPEAREQAAADYLEEASRQSLRARILWLFPLAGMAPDAWQRDWEAKTALNMTLVSAASAVTTLFIFMTLIQSFPQLPAHSLLWPVVLYLGFDAFVRLIKIVFSGKPRGIIALNLPYVLWELARAPKKESGDRRSVLEDDEIIRRPATGHLVIRSLLFDDWLAGPLPIRFGSTLYRPLDWRLEGKGLGRRYVYEFEKIEKNGRFRDYTRPRQPERQKVAETLTRSFDRVYMLAWVWGTYPSTVQRGLEAKYRFPAIEMTAATASLLLAGAIFQLWTMHLIGAPRATYAVAAYFFLESPYRLYRAKAQGQPTGSALGVVLGWVLAPPR